MPNKNSTAVDAVNDNLMNGQGICSILQEHYNLSPEEKKHHLKSEAAKFLFAGLPSRVSMILKEGFLSGRHGKDVPNWEEVVEYFQLNSRIIPALTKNAGTYTMLEKMYHFQSVFGVIDNYFLMSIAGGQALKNRYDTVNNFAVKAINQVLISQKECLMIDIGSGPGRNGIDLSLRNVDFSNRLQVKCIEIDSEAIDKGLELVAENRLTNIEFVRESMVKLNGRFAGKVDLGLNIGVVCGLPYQDRVKLLASHIPWFRPGGKLFVAGLTERMAQKDLLCAYLLRETTGWGLQFRPLGDLRMAAEEAGWKYIQTFSDQPTNLYDIDVLEAP